MTPGPPPLVSIARREPPTRVPEARVWAAAISWLVVATRTAPARRIAASKTSSRPTLAPVWETTARLPTSLRPDLITMTGLMRAAIRRPLIKERASATPSMYSRMLLVCESSAR